MLLLERALPDLEPSCPSCRTANALLHHSRPKAERRYEDLKCRDCGAIFLEEEYRLKDVR